MRREEMEGRGKGNENKTKYQAKICFAARKFNMNEAK